MACVVDTTTAVPIAGGRDVELEPGKPWPAPYRGSRYSLIESRRHRQTVLQWKYRDLQVFVDPPEGLESRLQELGKSRGSGKGSIRITAGGEILTKVHSTDYPAVHTAPVDTGWISVYCGKLDGELGFDIQVDPTPPEDTIGIWGGFPFNHGERWAVGLDGQLVWKWRGYRFYSAFDHPELIAAYNKYRRTPGRLYINELGHIFINASQAEVPTESEAELAAVYDEWTQEAARTNDTAAQRLVSRRLTVTGDGDPSEGLLPVYLGHLSQFDGGAIPRPVVDDETYYVAAAKGEELDDY